jgi:hypothetical protein
MCYVLLYNKHIGLQMKHKQKTLTVGIAIEIVKGRYLLEGYNLEEAFQLAQSTSFSELLSYCEGNDSPEQVRKMIEQAKNSINSIKH